MDDDEVFERGMASLGVEPLGGSKPAASSESDELDASDRRLFERAMRQLDEAGGKEAGGRAADGGGPPPVRRLKGRGGHPRIDERIDLHGLMAAEALLRLERCVDDASAAGSKTLLVITGKGHHSPGGRGVLKRRVEEWVRGPGRRRVRAYSEAPRTLGGGGAWVLHLRRP